MGLRDPSMRSIRGVSPVGTERLQRGSVLQATSTRDCDADGRVDRPAMLAQIGIRSFQASYDVRSDHSYKHPR